MMITGRPGYFCLANWSSSSPPFWVAPPGMRMSVTSTWGLSRSSAASASWALLYVWHGRLSRARVFSSTQRIDWSSSTIQIGFIGLRWGVPLGPAGGATLSFEARLASLMEMSRNRWLPQLRKQADKRVLGQRQKDREFGSSRTRIPFDQAFVLLYKGLGQRKPEAAAAVAPRHERHED